MVKTSTMKPFEVGDVFLGCTYLCDPNDDHAGEGRILQFDKHLVPKGTLYTEGTTHLIKNVRFAPDGVLWAFDDTNHAIVRAGRDGRQLPNHAFGDRAFGNAVFTRDGSIYLGEYLIGETPHSGTIAKRLPGTNIMGHGNLHKFNADFEPVAEYETETCPTITGFHGITHTALHPSERYITYLTDLGHRVMRYDIVNTCQMPDLVTLPEGDELIREWTTGVAYLSDGTLVLLRGSFMDFVNEGGETVRSIPLDEYGYAMIDISGDDRFAFVANIFTGVASKVDLASGYIIGQIDTGFAKPYRSLAGIAVFDGP